jgi:hypothetical protein
LKGVAVGELTAAGVDLGVQAGAHEVADADLIAVRQRSPRRPDTAHLGELGLYAPGQLGGFGIGPGEQEHVLAA